MKNIDPDVQQQVESEIKATLRRYGYRQAAKDWDLVCDLEHIVRTSSGSYLGQSNATREDCQP
jgi:hypothetical protein